jgi:hypothetical protein
VRLISLPNEKQKAVDYRYKIIKKVGMDYFKKGGILPAKDHSLGLDSLNG